MIVVVVLEKHNNRSQNYYEGVTEGVIRSMVDGAAM